jgi:ribonuclease-3
LLSQLPVSEKLAALQGLLGYEFRQISVCLQALTHRSYNNQHNERLEFLGDAILDLLVSEWLYRKFPSATEGELSHMRASIVCGENLAMIARQLELGSHLYLGAGEVGSGGRERQSTLANALEALLAAIYLDGGLEACRATTEKLFAPVLASVVPGTGKDAKTQLQEYMQARQLPLPTYRLLERSGSEHEARFTMQCAAEALGLAAEAVAGSRKKAEQLAAEKVLELLESNH